MSPLPDATVLPLAAAARIDDPLKLLRHKEAVASGLVDLALASGCALPVLTFVRLQARAWDVELLRSFLTRVSEAIHPPYSFPAALELARILAVAQARIVAANRASASGGGGSGSGGGGPQRKHIAATPKHSEALADFAKRVAHAFILNPSGLDGTQHEREELMALINSVDVLGAEVL